MFINEKADSAASYAIGIGAMTIPQFIAGATSIFQLLITIGGFIIVCLRIRYEFKKVRDQ